jgi:membrane associated rhomboid family serine protease
VLGFWIVLQVISQYTASFSHTTQTGGVAYMAHIGGFVAGVALIKLFAVGRPAPGPVFRRGGGYGDY